jgi:diguanylate cyclase (GGDEF)-like protein
MVRTMTDFRDTLAHDDSPINLLLVGDHGTDASQIREILETSHAARFEIAHADQVEQALRMLQREPYDVVLLDLSVSGDGLSILARAKVAAETLPIIAIASCDDEATALQALRLGAQDYLVRDELDSRRLVRSLRHALERHRLLTELQAAKKRAFFVALHDTLTGLPNRSFFQDQLHRTLVYADRNQQEVAVLFVDLDRFKTINDTLGHPAGDAVLKEAASRLSGMLRRSDVVARLGGDEFVVMLQNAQPVQSVAKVAEKLISEMRRPYVLGGRQYWLSASVGVAAFPRDGGDPDTLIRNADTAMYYAKTNDKNHYQFFNKHMNAAAEKKLMLETNLRAACERGDLQIVYQPIIDIDTNQILAAEALLRWRDQELGVVPPSEFIPVAEDTKLIVPMGEWVLRTACKRTKTWHDAGFPIQMMVNLSPVQVQRRTLREFIARCLWDTGLAAHHLELELTESGLMQTEEASIGILRDLKELGIRISLDDFGTGFSSLSYLKRFPLDTVKIDRSFTRDSTIDPDDAAIISAILSIGTQLDLTVIAEGVETNAQRVFLRERGCRVAQGYLFSPPLSGGEFLELLKRGLPAPGEEKGEQQPAGPTVCVGNG